MPLCLLQPMPDIRLPLALSGSKLLDAYSDYSKYWLFTLFSMKLMLTKYLCRLFVYNVLNLLCNSVNVLFVFCCCCIFFSFLFIFFSCRVICFFKVSVVVRFDLKFFVVSYSWTGSQLSNCLSWNFTKYLHLFGWKLWTLFILLHC